LAEINKTIRRESWTLGALGKKANEWIGLQTLASNNRASSKMTLAFTCAK
jgi:hypothetical protein